MSRGITQDQVNEAIEALLARGDRPTTERVRGYLGTGSMSTITRMVDVWWKQLPARLHAQAPATVSIPDAPPAVSAAASSMWAAALEEARNQARADYEQAHARLEADRHLLEQERQDLMASVQRREEEAAAALAHMEQARQLAETRLSEVQRRLEERNVLFTDLSARLAREEENTARLRSGLDKLAGELGRERERYGELVQLSRQTEDRLMVEIDALRQDLKTARQQGEQQRQQHQDALARKDGELAELGRRMIEAERHRAAAEAKVGTLEREISRLHEHLVRQASARRPVRAGSGARRHQRNRALPSARWTRVKTRAGGADLGRCGK